MQHTRRFKSVGATAWVTGRAEGGLRTFLCGAAEVNEHDATLTRPPHQIVRRHVVVHIAPAVHGSNGGRGADERGLDLCLRPLMPACGIQGLPPVHDAARRPDVAVGRAQVALRVGYDVNGAWHHGPQLGVGVQRQFALERRSFGVKLHHRFRGNATVTLLRTVQN